METKVVELTDFERKVILENLTHPYSQLCKNKCYCNYKDPICEEIDSNGKHKCKLIFTLVRKFTREINVKENEV